MIFNNLESLLYLAFCLFNAILYVTIKLFSNSTGMTTLQIAAYMNIGVFTLYNVFFIKKIWKDSLYLNIFKLSNIILSAGLVSAVTKMYCIQYIDPRDAVIITHTTPFLVMLFATIFLKEKMVAKYWLYGLLSLFGVCIYVWKKIELHSFYYAILLLHVAFKATMHIATRKVAKSSVFNVMFYDNLFYSVFGVTYLTANFGGVDLRVFMQWQIFAIIAITTISLFSLVKAYSIANSGITKLQNLDFSKIIFTFILSVMFLDEKVETNELIGLGIILLSIALSQISFKKNSPKVL